MAQIEVDQSIKIEQRGDSIIAAARGRKSCAVIIDRRLKRTMLNYSRRLTRKRVFLSLFALGAAFAVSKLYEKEDKITLDEEYEGNEVAIEEIFYSVSLKLSKNINKKDITSSKIGKRCWADLVARNPSLANYKISLGMKDRTRILKLLGWK